MNYLYVLASQCRAGAILFKNICYKLFSEQTKDFTSAQSTCSAFQGRLAIMGDVKTNNFLSELILALQSHHIHYAL